MKARELMTAEHLWALAEDSTVQHAAELLAQHDIGSAPVLDRDGRVVGIITDRDLCCRALAKGISGNTPVRDIMSSEVWCVTEEADEDDVEEVMRQHQIRRVPVVDTEEHLRGVIATADIFRHCQGKKEEVKAAEVMEDISMIA